LRRLARAARAMDEPIKPIPISATRLNTKEELIRHTSP